MNFYRMDGIDTVAAETEEQAINFYISETGFKKEDITEIEKLSAYRTMWVELDFLTEDEKNQAQIMQRGPYGGLEVKMSFKDVFEREGRKAPYIIASTER